MNTPANMRVTSEPNEKGEHSLRCPNCKKEFLSTIQQDDKTAKLYDITCPACGNTEEPKVFVLSAQQEQVNNIAFNHITEELRRSFGKSFKARK